MKTNIVKKIREERRVQQGFTMVELLVALLLSAGLLFGVLQIFDTNRQSSTMQNALSEVQEGGRIAVEMISRDIRMANSWGCNQNRYPQDTTGLIVEEIGLLPGATGVQTSWGRGGVTGTNNVGALIIGGRTVEPGTDEFSLRGSFIIPNAVIRQPYMTNVGSDIVIGIGADIPSGTPLVISSCLSSDLFVNTQADTATTGIIAHANPFMRVYDGSAKISRPFTHQYFVGQNVGGGTSLYRRVDNNLVADELVRNVSDMQVLYGLDSDIDGSADQFIASPSAAEFLQVISIRFQLTLDSQSNVNDSGVLQKTFVATANIRNKSLQ